MKLTYRLAAWLVAGNCAVLGLYGYLALCREVASFEGASQRETALAAQTLLALVEDAWREDGRGAALGLISRANRSQDELRFRWIGAAAWPPRLAARLAREPLLHERADGHLHTYVRFAAPDEVGALEVSKAFAGDQRYVRASLQRLSVASGVSVLLSALLAVHLSRTVVGLPVATLLDKVQRVGSGDLSGPVELGRRDELGRLADAIDAMAADLLEARRRAARETSEREAATRQLRHAERLATVGRLAAGLAHELGTPLNVLLARAGMIARAEVSEAVRQNAEVIREQVRRMSRTIRQLLDFARRSEPHRTRVDLRELAARTLGVLGPLAQERGVPLELGETPGEAWADVDGEQLQQVLTNLLVNAIHATGARGTPVRLTITRVPAAPPRGGPPRTCWRLAVRDQGTGIPEELRQRIFEPFFTTKDVGEGTGLGLTVAHGIVAEHDGWIGVESEVGAGSELAVFLPAEEVTG